MTQSISIIIPVIERGDGAVQLHQRYADNLRGSAAITNLEFIYVITPAYAHLIDELMRFREAGEPVSVIELSRNFGEAAAIKVGVEQAKYKAILTLPCYEQVPPESIASILDDFGQYDVIIVRRWPRRERGLRKLQSQLLNAILSRVATAPFGDIGCGVRLCDRKVFDEITLYGDFHRFLAMLAYEQGFAVKITDLPQSQEDNRKPVLGPRSYLGRLLDVVTIVFLTKFNKRPLRFFGSLGSLSLMIGSLGLLYIGFERIFLQVGAADRPIMLLFLLLAVLGVQLLAIGLVGETLIFTHAGDIKEYKIKQIHEAP